MEDIPDNYDLESVEQLRAISDELRIRILDTLAHQRMTVTQLGERFGLAPARVHYHVRELERVGLVKLVETRENRGILEKYYRSVAKGTSVPDSLLRSIPADDSLAAMREFLRIISQGALRAFQRGLSSGELVRDVSSLADITVFLTSDEAKQVTQQIYDLLKPYTQPRGIEGERECAAVSLLYARGDAQETGGEGVDADTDAESERKRTEPPSPTARSQKPRIRTGVVVGSVSYSRRDLERLVEHAERLSLNVLGQCDFDDDVTADLADLAIERFRHRGPLHAPAAVREVLKRKQAGQDTASGEKGV